MPQTPHVEKHFTASETVRDIVIGMSDGLTVPFALAAGLSGAVETSDIIVTAGLAEVAAGAIAKRLGLPHRHNHLRKCVRQYGYRHEQLREVQHDLRGLPNLFWWRVRLLGSGRFAV